MGKLGYNTLTLTDLTETLPISLILESNQEQNIQTKEGDFYTPNFSLKGEELIITPSLFLGSIEKEIPVNYTEGSYIYYEIGEMEKLEDGSVYEKQYYFYEGNESEEIYVDNKGCLHYKKNLERNLTIEAYVTGFKNKVDQDSTIFRLVRAQNPITILLLEQGKGMYTLVISSNDGREHFEENNKKEITLTATLYKGSEAITEGVTYLWDTITDSDDNSNNDFKKEGKEITIQRTEVNNIQVYQCSATLNGLEYSSQKIIRNFTDGYTNQLIADSSLILTPNKTTVTLTNQVWYQTEIINRDGISEEEAKRFQYKWILLKSDNAIETELEGKTEKILEIDINNPVYPKENFSILGMVTIDKKTVIINYADIKYQPVTYTVNVSPKTIFIPVTSDGQLREADTFVQQIKFQLLDDKKQPLDYNLIDGFPTPQENISIVTQEEGKWDFILKFELSKEDVIDLETSNIYEFSYSYLEQNFNEEFEVIKNFAGIDGKDGENGQSFSGYTVDLSNEFHAFSGGEAQATPNEKAFCTVSAFYGSDKCDIKKIKVNDEIIFGEGSTEEINLNNKNLFISAAEIGEKQVQITFTSGKEEDGKFLKDILPVKFQITIKDINNKEMTFLKTFSYIINYSSKSYFLSLSDNVIQYSEATGSYFPNRISVSALSRETNGESNAYDGLIIYSFDKDTWIKYEANKGISEYKNLQNIYIKLYSKQASSFENSSSWFSENDKYLLDSETIPVLTSLEGYQIGGENLIKWSKTLSIETNKWYENNSNNVANILDGDFTTKVWSAGAASSLVSPKISYAEEYAGKTFCLSFYIKRDNLLNSTASGSAHYFNVYLTSTQLGNDYTIGSIYAASSKDFIIEEGEGYQKAYALFNFPSSVTSDFYIRFGCRVDTQGTFSLKKPKLELGNIPSDWSSSPYDIDFSDVSGINLIKSNITSLTAVFEEEETLLAENLSTGFYTVSWERCSFNETVNSSAQANIVFKNSSNIEIGVIPLTETADSQTIKIDSEADCYLKNTYEKITISKLKLEKGYSATPYFLSNEDILQQIKNSELSAKEYALTQVQDPEGNKIFVPVNELEKLVNSYIKIDQIKGEITGINEILGANVTSLQIARTYFSLDSGVEDGQPSLVLATEAGKENGNKMKLTDTSLQFFVNNSETPVAEITNSELLITNATIKNSLRIGGIKFIPSPTGVAVVWEKEE